MNIFIFCVLVSLRQRLYYLYNKGNQSMMDRLLWVTRDSWLSQLRSLWTPGTGRQWRKGVISEGTGCERVNVWYQLHQSWQNSIQAPWWGHPLHVLGKDLPDVNDWLQYVNLIHKMLRLPREDERTKKAKRAIPVTWRQMWWDFCQAVGFREKNK